MNRHNPRVLEKDDWVTYRALESYGGTYMPHMDREVAESVRGLALKSVFHERTVEKGGIFGEAYGWERPLYYRPGNKILEETRDVENGRFAKLRRVFRILGSPFGVKMGSGPRAMLTVLWRTLTT